MQTPKLLALAALSSALFSCPSSRAQTAYWTNSAGGEWNVPANWNVDMSGLNAVPGVGTNADIGSQATAAVTYDAPMSAASFASLLLQGGSSLDVNAAGFAVDNLAFGTAPLTINGTLNVNSGGALSSVNGGTSIIGFGGIFNVAGSALLSATGFVPLNVDVGGVLNVNSGGTLTIADGEASTVSDSGLIHLSGGTLIFSNSAALHLLTGSALTVDGGSLIGTNNFGEFAFGEGTGSDANAGVAVTNNGGSIILDTLLRVRSRDTRFAQNGGVLDLRGGLALDSSGNDSRQWFLINGGTANLGDLTVNRATTSGGLRIEDGIVTSSSARIGIGVASAYSIMTGGVWSNTGAFYVADRNNAATSKNRRVYFRVDGGELISEGADGIIINNQGQEADANLSNIGGELIVNGGTITAEGIQLNGPAVAANAYARLTVNDGTIYLGSVGLVAHADSANALTAVISLSGGTFGAKADWASAANLPMSSTLTFKAADASDAAHNISLSGVLSGSGGLLKTGAGTLSLSGTNTYSGITHILEGTLALTGDGSLTSPQIDVGPGTTFDVSGVNGGYVLAGARTLFGSGTVAGTVNVAAGSVINPGSNTLTGTLTLDSLAATGDAILHFDLSTDPEGAENDFISLNGDLNLSGITTLEIIGGGGAGSVHPLIHYGGTFSGSLANLAISGASGTLTNNTVTKTIELVIESSIRNPTSVVWAGSATENVWDILDHQNWLNGGTPDIFVTGDTVLFDAAGAAHPTVMITDNVAPAALTVDAVTDYSFSGDGSISGATGLNKANSGKLTINTTNTYTGPTVITGGTLAAGTIANASFGSSIGAANVDPANLVLDNGTLEYLGNTASTTRGATLDSGGGTIQVDNSAALLSINGNVLGAGALIKNGPGALAFGSANSYAGGTIVNGGVFQMGNANSAGYGSITANDGAVLRYAGSYTMTNNVQVNGNVTLDMNDNVPSGDRHLVGDWTGTGTINISNISDIGRTITLGGLGGLSGFNGTIDLGNSSLRFRFNHDDASPNTGSPNLHLNLGTGTVYFEPRNGGVTIDIGALEGGPATVVRGRASGNSGTVTYAIGALNLSTVFEGGISNSPSGNLTGLRKVGDGKLTLTGVSGYTDYTYIEGGTLQVDGQLGDTFMFVGPGTLSGSGTLNGFVEIQGGGTLSPGSPVGTMTFNNYLQIDGGSTTIMELNPAQGTNDSIVANGGLMLGGTLVVTNVGGSFTAGQTFKLFESLAGYEGGFEALELPALGNGMSWNTDNLTSDGTITIIGVTLPQITVQSGGGKVILNGVNGAPGATYNVLTSTNLASPLANWTAIETNVFDGTGAFSFTNSIDPNAPQRFFILFVP
ncbi:MAG TPA: autotransporter-associated beta strand repeat-containing protein [Verrucomicrobiae bacterium]|nr:autotransporter-associated beta strand repeat-containing protein [Verrucomicrobiae bacterium]